MLVENIMQAPVITIDPDTSIEYAVQILRNHNIRHLPVVENNALVGIVSDRDLRDACPSSIIEVGFSPVYSTPVRQIMRSPVITVHPLDFFDEAARLIYEHKVGCLPVVSNRQVIGIISQSDILRHLVGMLGMLSPGSYVEVDIPDRPGVLAEITQIIREYGVNVSSILLCPAKENGRKCLVLRIQAFNLDKILKRIEGAGYRITWPVTTGG